jgi:hypothetical protein
MAAKESPVLSERLIYHTLIFAAIAVVCGHIMGILPPVLGENDRSRWATVHALVDHGTYAIGHRVRHPAGGWYSDRGIIAEQGWNTIDKVLRPDTQDFYSSKPPLLPTLVAGEYWVLKKALGWSITEQRGYVVRVILLTINALPLLFYLVFLGRLVEWLGITQWGRFYVLVAACFGTFLTTFAATFNNHTVAACCALFALEPFLRIWSEVPLPGHEVVLGAAQSRLGSIGQFVRCGLFASLTACVELPASLFAVTLLLLLLWRNPRRTLLFFLPAVALPAGGFFLTNYLALGQFRPAYMEGGGPWYHFEGSYWESLMVHAGHSNLDLAGRYETKFEYAFHTLEGHHGIFSLSPIFLLTAAGVICGTARRLGQAIPNEKVPPVGGDSASYYRFRSLRVLNGLTLILTIALLVFYITRTSNYGGGTSGPRWFIWLTPFWLLAMLPIIDSLASRRWGRGLANVLLAVSIFSAHYTIDNPWRHPWIYDFLKDQGYFAY